MVPWLMVPWLTRALSIAAVCVVGSTLLLLVALAIAGQRIEIEIGSGGPAVNPVSHDDVLGVDFEPLQIDPAVRQAEIMEMIVRRGSVLATSSMRDVESNEFSKELAKLSGVKTTDRTSPTGEVAALLLDTSRMLRRNAERLDQAGHDAVATDLFIQADRLRSAGVMIQANQELEMKRHDDNDAWEFTYTRQ